jgi:AsmA protein
VRFTGPFLVMTAAGAADLRTRMLDFRADPRLVASAGTPGEAPRDIGVPVVIQGPWSAPRIYADTPNILANPETALRALRDALGGRRSKGRRPTRRSASLSRAFPRDSANPTGKRRVTVAGSRRTC